MIDHDRLRDIDVAEFLARQPFPWLNLEDFLTAAAFHELHATFPPRERFEWHENRERRYGQRPHNRYYLELEGRHSAPAGAAGMIRKAELPAPWQALIEELDASRPYRELVGRLLQITEWETRYAWHLGVRGSEVSPHADSDVKFGTHILYFNTTEDWRPEWGGATLLLGGKAVAALDPDFGDFATTVETKTVGNRSLLFRNLPEAWHGVRALTCPPGSHRRLFNVIFERPRRRKTAWERIRRALPLARGQRARVH
jgi:hypothetical protein